MTEMILTSSVLMLAIILLRRVLRGRMAPGLQYALWLLAALRLLLPGSLFPAPVSAAGTAAELRSALVRQEASGQGGMVYGPSELEPGPLTPLPDTGAPEGAPAGGSSQSPAESAAPVRTRGASLPWYVLVWAAGAAAVGGAFLVSNLAFYLALYRGRKRLCLPMETGAWDTPVYLVKNIDSPCIFGLCKPAVYVNEAALRTENFEHILLHELTHIRHGDHWWSLVRCVCLSLHWFNPLVWWAAVLSRRDCELACDAGVIRRLGEERRLDYGQTLLRMIIARPGPRDLLRASTSMSAGKRTMAERLRMIARRPRMLKITLAAVVVLMCGVVVFTFGGQTVGGEPEGGEDIENIPADTVSETTQEVIALLREAQSGDGVLTATWFAGSLSSGGAPATMLVDSEYLLEDAFLSCQWFRAEAPEREPDCETMLQIYPFTFYSGSDLVRYGGEQNLSFETTGPEERWYTAADIYTAVNSALAPPMSHHPEPGFAVGALGAWDAGEHNHTSGMFSFAVPESWVGEVIYDEGPDSVAFYEAELYREGTRDGWLMSIVPQPVSWAEAYGQNDIALEGFNFNGSPYLYMVQVNPEPSLARNQEQRAKTMELMGGAQALADSFRLTLTEKDLYSFVQSCAENNEMSLAVCYLPYLDWSGYKAVCGEDGMWELLSGISAYIEEYDVTWGETHNILSNRSRNDPAIDGAYSTMIQEGILWPLYQKDPAQFSSVLNSIYLTEDERADILEWIQPLLSENGGSVPSDDSAAPAAGPDGQTINAWQRSFAGWMLGVPAAPDQEVLYDGLEEGSLRAAVLSRLEEYAELYLEENGNPDYNTRFSRIALESEIPESMDYGAELTVRYQIEGLQDRTYEGKSYTLASQPGDRLSTTFTVMERNAFMGQLRVAGAMGELGG